MTSIIFQLGGEVKDPQKPAVIFHSGQQRVYRFDSGTPYSVKLRRMTFNLLLAVTIARKISHAELIDYFYGDDPDGGLEGPAGTFYVLKCNANKLILPLKMQIKTKSQKSMEIEINAFP